MTPFRDVDAPSRVVFLDRDGTIIEDVGYLHRIEQVEFIEGAIEGLKMLEGAGYALVVASNQSGVARGKFLEDDVRRVHEYVRSTLAVQGVHIRGFVYCPHHPEGEVPEYAIICDCRKPAAGLAKQVEAFLGPIDYAHSWTIGDKPVDVAFAKTLGARSALLRSRYWNKPPDPPPDIVASSLREAAQHILAAAE